MLKLGMFLQPIHPFQRDQGDIYREAEEKIILADQLGFGEAWVGEHYSASTEPITSPLIFLASLIHRTKQIKLGTGTLNLPNHHPAMVAGNVALFDHLSSGRLLLGIGPGGLATDFELFGTQDFKNRAEAVMESYEMILKLWSEDPPFDIKGKYWSIKMEKNVIKNLGVGPVTRPFQKPHPPFATSAVSPFSNSIRTAAQKGWYAISTNFAPNATIASHWKVFCDGCNDVGRAPDGDAWRVARTVVVAPSDAEAQDYIHDPKRATHAYFNYLIELLKTTNALGGIKPRPEMTDDQVTADEVVKAVVIAGSPKTVAEKILAYREEVGPFGHMLLSAMDWEGQNRKMEKRSMEMLARDVMPDVNRALEGKA